VLNLNGILFAAQLACLLVLGPYADYGTWRAWLTIGELTSEVSLNAVFQTVLNVCTIAMAGLNKPSQWQAASALYVIGNMSEVTLSVELIRRSQCRQCVLPRCHPRSRSRSPSHDRAREGSG
jgi:hypothetical protein